MERPLMRKIRQLDRRMPYTKLLAGALLWALLTGIGPFERWPGGRLAGPVQDQVITDWRFVESAGRCAVEVRPLFPHSVTVNCWHHEGKLYVGCMQCENKIWSEYISVWPDARVRIASKVYPVHFSRVMSSVETEQSWRARWLNLGRSLPAASIPDHYWLFRVASR